MLTDRLTKGLVLGHAGFVQGRYVELDEAGPLLFPDSEAAVRRDQVYEAELPAEAVGPSASSADALSLSEFRTPWMAAIFPSTI
jgi:hypothetical protein